MPRLSLLTILCVAATGTALAGPLDPPPGPITSTYKTLTEVEPRTAINSTNTPGDNDSTPSVFQISTPGSYYLTGNVVAPAGTIGIEITVTSGAVTIDLNGFAVRGPGAGAVTPGIDFGRANDVAIVNGTVANFMGTGINGPNSANCRLERVRIQQCRESGARLQDSAVVRDCEFVSNGAGGGVNKDGCEVGNAAVVSGSVFRSNAGNGLSADEGATISGCTARNNVLDGIVATEGATISGCTAKFNQSDGIAVGGGCTISACTADDNTVYGIRTSDSGLNDGGTSIIGCSAGNNGSDGIATTFGCSVSNCSTRRNTGVGVHVSFGCTVTGSSSAFDLGGGFSCGTGSTIDTCSVFNSGAVGIVATDNSSVINCMSRANSRSGIQVGSLCTIQGNTCLGNGPTAQGGSGIFVTGGGAVIQGNFCSNNATNGIQITGTANEVLGNTCTGNSGAGGNYNMVSGNRVGTIVVPPVSGAISGNAGAAGMGSTDPTVNFAY